MRDGRVRRAYLGIVGGTRPLPATPSPRGLGRPRGLEVVQLLDGSPAAAPACAPATSSSSSTAARSRASATSSGLVGDVIGRRVELRIERGSESRSVSVSPVELTA